MINSVLVPPTTIRELTLAYLTYMLRRYRQRHPGKISVILSDVAGSSWDAPLMPFYNLYGGRGRVAGAEMGKLFSKAAKELGMDSRKEDRFGKKDAITRYFFVPVQV